MTLYLKPTPILPTLFHRIFIKKTLIKKSLLFRYAELFWKLEIWTGFPET